MALVPRAGYCAHFVLLSLAVTGCGLAKPSVRQSTPIQAQTAPPPPAQSVTSLPSTATPDQQSQLRPQAPVRQASHQIADQRLYNGRASDELFAGERQLSPDQLIAEVEARNPSLQAMAYAWRAAAQRYPQVVRLDDPTFMAMMAPESFNSNQVNPGYTLQGAQKLPWFGKLQTRGQGAQAEAGAAFQDVQDARLVIYLVARLAFYDYYLAERQLQINAQNRLAAQEFRDSAQVKYENNQVTQLDVIQADVELADLRRRQIELERMRRVAVARINTLLLRVADGPLPPSPQSLPPVDELPRADALRQMALARRPDLAAISARVRAEQAAVDLALLQYYPDVEVFGRYDAFWQETELQGSAGMNLNVPIYRRRLNAAVSEAQFRLGQRRAEYRQRVLDIQYEVQSAYEQVEEARQTVELYHTNYLPLAEQNLTLARADYDVGRGTYLNLVMAQRQLFVVREQHEQALTDYHRRTADLERAIGGQLPESGGPEEIPRPGR
jgi:outer membrane protein TolC